MNNLKRITFSIAAAVAISAGAISPAMAQSSMSSASPIGSIIDKNPIIPIGETEEEREHKMEEETFRLLNEHRVNNGLKPLIVDPTLTNLAQHWSSEMADTYYRHSDYGLRENIAFDTNANLSSMFYLWKNSPPHNENMLTQTNVYVGIGMEIDHKGDTYATMMFR